MDVISINFPILDEPLQIKGATFLVIQDQIIFANVVNQLYSYSEESDLKLFDDNYKKLKESEVILVTDVFNFQINTSAIIKLIHLDILGQLNDNIEQKLLIQEQCLAISKILAKECQGHEINLVYNELDIPQMLSALKVKIKEHKESLINKMLDIIQVYKYLPKKRLLIFVNVTAYLSREEVLAVVEFIQLQQVRVLFIEPKVVYDMPQYVLDEDFYLNEENMI